ncbi:MAG TPA: hypothetical protein P5549_04220 [Syntrophomonas sp.]|nr:hypothetical protein [Syntrophomonas sp.]
MAGTRHLFPGANSCYGFFSFYDQIVPPQVKTKVILKGGPGTGKSTFMKSIADDLGSQQIEAECHWCSSDNNSLDAVVGGHGQVCILDGTSPHVVDPRYPGAVDRIINLGEYWDASLLKKNRADIEKLTDLIGLSFQRATTVWQNPNWPSGNGNPTFRKPGTSKQSNATFWRWRKNFYRIIERPGAGCVICLPAPSLLPGLLPRLRVCWKAI